MSRVELSLYHRINAWLLEYRKCVYEMATDTNLNIELEEKAMALEREWRGFLEEIDELEHVY